MTSKYQRPAGAYAGGTGLANRTKYQDDATATPKRAVSSAKVDGDLNFVVDSLNQIDEASGTRASIDERLNVSLNADGTLKVTVAGALDEWIVHTNGGTLARMDNSTFTMSGDWRGIYQVNRRIRVTVAGVGLIGDIAEVMYSGGITTVECVDLLDGGGFAGIISVAPTQVAYGPLTAGTRGNTPRRFNSVRIPAGFITYEVLGSGSNLLVTRDGVAVAGISDTGVSGIAPGSVSKVTLDAAAQALLVPSGAVMPFAGASVPTGWLLCAGQAVSRTTYASLFAVIGTTYGAGDGSTFGIPDLRGRAVFGLDNMNGTDAGRLSVANTLGISGGAQTKSGSTDSYTLTVTDIPAHTHDANAVSGAAANNPTGPAVSADTGTSGTRVVTKTTGGGGGHSHGITNFDVMPPYMLMNHIIKV